MELVDHALSDRDTLWSKLSLSAQQYMLTVQVKKEHLLHSARTVRRRITPEMIRFFDEWRDQSGVRSA